MRVYLADLGHNQVTKSSDSYPLGVANLATYVLDRLKSDSRPEISIFREPEDLKAALDATAPDVLGLSSYSWNHHLALSFARYAKRKDAQTITMMGGPNFPLTAVEQESFTPPSWSTPEMTEGWLQSGLWVDMWATTPDGSVWYKLQDFGKANPADGFTGVGW